MKFKGTKITALILSVLLATNSLSPLIVRAEDIPGPGNQVVSPIVAPEPTPEIGSGSPIIDPSTGTMDPINGGDNGNGNGDNGNSENLDPSKLPVVEKPTPGIDPNSPNVTPKDDDETIIDKIIDIIEGDNKDSSGDDDEDEESEDEQEDQNISYTVTFIDGYDNSIISTQSVIAGGSVIFPGTPEHENYIFIGWSSDGTNIQSDETITAIYKEKSEIEYTVTFIDSITEEVLCEKKVGYGEAVEAPEPPKHEGYEFKEWDGNLEEITSDCEIRAVYTALDPLEIIEIESLEELQSYLADEVDERLIIESDHEILIYDSTAIHEYHFENYYIVSYVSALDLMNAAQDFVDEGYVVDYDYTLFSESVSEEIQEAAEEADETEVTTKKEIKKIEKRTNSSYITIAVIDTGITSTNPIFNGKIVEGISSIDASTETYNDNNGHGTMVTADILESIKDTDAYDDIMILPIKALDENGEGSVLSVYTAIKYAIKNDVDVINISMASVGDSNMLRNVINEAYNNGITVVVSAGNNSLDVSAFTPGNIDTAITVSAVDEMKNFAPYSNFGAGIDFAADGYYSYVGEGFTTNVIGTSFAAAKVTAFVALLKASSKAPVFTETMMYTSLLMSATDLGDPGFDVLYGNGYLDVDNLVVSDEYQADTKLNINYEILEGDENINMEAAASSVSVTVNNETQLASAINSANTNGRAGRYEVAINIGQDFTLNQVLTVSNYAVVNLYLNGHTLTIGPSGRLCSSSQLIIASGTSYNGSSVGTIRYTGTTYAICSNNTAGENKVNIKAVTIDGSSNNQNVLVYGSGPRSNVTIDSGATLQNAHIGVYCAAVMGELSHYRSASVFKSGGNYINCDIGIEYWGLPSSWTYGKEDTLAEGNLDMQGYIENTKYGTYTGSFTRCKVGIYFKDTNYKYNEDNTSPRVTAWNTSYTDCNTAILCENAEVYAKGTTIKGSDYGIFINERSYCDASRSTISNCKVGIFNLNELKSFTNSSGDSTGLVIQNCIDGIVNYKAPGISVPTVKLNSAQIFNCDRGITNEGGKLYISGADVQNGILKPTVISDCREYSVYHRGTEFKIQGYIKINSKSAPIKLCGDRYIYVGDMLPGTTASDIYYVDIVDDTQLVSGNIGSDITTTENAMKVTSSINANPNNGNAYKKIGHQIATFAGLTPAANALHARFKLAKMESPALNYDGSKFNGYKDSACIRPGSAETVGYISDYCIYYSGKYNLTYVDNSVGNVDGLSIQINANGESYNTSEYSEGGLWCENSHFNAQPEKKLGEDNSITDETIATHKHENIEDGSHVYGTFVYEKAENTFVEANFVKFLGWTTDPKWYTKSGVVYGSPEASKIINAKQYLYYDNYFDMNLTGNTEIYAAWKIADTVEIQYYANNDTEDYVSNMLYDNVDDDGYYSFINKPEQYVKTLTKSKYDMSTGTYKDMKYNYVFVGWSLMNDEAYQQETGNPDSFITYKQDLYIPGDATTGKVLATDWAQKLINADKISINDHGNIVIKLYATWDENPTITATNYYITPDEIDMLTEQIILDGTKAAASDREDDINGKKVTVKLADRTPLATIKHNLKNVGEIGAVSVTLETRDSRYNSTLEKSKPSFTTVMIYVMKDKELSQRTLVRFIDNENYNKGIVNGSIVDKEVDGALMVNSVWYNKDATIAKTKSGAYNPNADYKALIQRTLSNLAKLDSGDSSGSIYTIDMDLSAIDASKEYTKDYRHGNAAGTGNALAGWTQLMNSKNAITTDKLIETAVEDAEEYTVIYYADVPEGCSSEVQGSMPQTLKKKNDHIDKCEYSLTGYKFGGWRTVSRQTSMSGKIYNDGQSLYRVPISYGTTITLYAVWTPISYTVTYDPNNAAVAQNSTDKTQKANYDEYIELKDAEKDYTCPTVNIRFDANGGTLSGKSLITAKTSFAGWSREPDGAAVYASKERVRNLTLEDNSVVNLYASWSTEMLTLPSASKEGYIFTGWWTTKDDSGRMIGKGNLKVTMSEDTKLYAHYDPISYTVRYDSNIPDGAMDFSGDIDDETFYNEVAQAISPTVPAITGYTFLGWSLASCGLDEDVPPNPFYTKPTVNYLPGQEMTNTVTKEGQIITLHAVWKAHKYSIEFVPGLSATEATVNMNVVVNPETLATSNTMNAYYGKTTTLPSTIPTAVSTDPKVTYEFLGYTYNGNAYAPGQSVLSLASDNGAVVEMKANWRRVKESDLKTIASENVDTGIKFYFTKTAENVASYKLKKTIVDDNETSTILLTTADFETVPTITVHDNENDEDIVYDNIYSYIDTDVEDNKTYAYELIGIDSIGTEIVNTGYFSIRCLVPFTVDMTDEKVINKIACEDDECQTANGHHTNDAVVTTRTVVITTTFNNKAPAAANGYLSIKPAEGEWSEKTKNFTTALSAPGEDTVVYTVTVTKTVVTDGVAGYTAGTTIEVVNTTTGETVLSDAAPEGVKLILEIVKDEIDNTNTTGIYYPGAQYSKEIELAIED